MPTLRPPLVRQISSLPNRYGTTILELPNELVLQISGYLEKPHDLSSLLRSCRRFALLVLPVLQQLLIRRSPYSYHCRHGWRSVLHRAVLQGGCASVEAIIKNGGTRRINIRDACKHSPLHLAVLNGHEDMVELLLKNGADTEIESVDRWTPLHCAIARGAHNIIGMLLDSGANSHARTSGNRHTALTHAAILGDTVAVSLLLRYGAGCGVPASWNASAMHCAGTIGRRDLMEFLENSGFAITSSQVAPCSLKNEQKRERQIFWTFLGCMKYTYLHYLTDEWTGQYTASAENSAVKLSHKLHRS